MTRFFTKGLLAITGALILFPAASMASPLFQFTYGSGGTFSTGTVSSTTYLTAFSETISQVVISGANADNGTYTITGGNFSESATAGASSSTFTVTGTINNGLLNGVSINFSWTAAASTVSGSTIAFGAATTLNSSSATLAADLGYTSFTGISVSGNALGSGGSVISNAQNQTLSGPTATPEPASFLLFGTGLFAVAFGGKKKFFSRS